MAATERLFNLLPGGAGPGAWLPALSAVQGGRRRVSAW